MNKPVRMVENDSFGFGLEKPRVLIVDDEQIVCDLLSSELEERSYSCVTTLDGSDAIAKLEEGYYFDVVLLDLKLPGMSGLQVLREIQAKHSHVATIVVTAVSDACTAVEAMKSGALDYIIKPFELAGVERSIRKALEGNRTVRNMSNMDAIAVGVEAEFDPFAAYTKAVVERTVIVARQLDIPDEEIQRWVEIQIGRETEKREKVESSLDKLKRNPVAQCVLGLTAHLPRTRGNDEHNN